MKKPIKKYHCRHCGKPYSSFAMADICYELDMKVLIFEPSKLKPYAKPINSINAVPDGSGSR